jgi:hypothetical protein
VAIQRSNRRAEKVKPMISIHTIINAYKILASNPHENRPLQTSTYITGIKLKWMINTQNVKTWDGFHPMTIEYNGELI